jgi:beta-lactam-binding protein with PASTA domain
VTGSTRAVGAGPGGPGGAGLTRAEEERRRKVRRLWIILGALLVVLAVIGVLLWQALDKTQKVSVPSVAGQTVSAATQTLHNENLLVGSTSLKNSSTVKGEVISTDPGAGVKVAKNSHVNLVVSAGVPVMVPVPQVVGQQLNAAVELLNTAGLSFKTTYVTSNKAPGTVLTQDPAAGVSVKTTTVVKLTVSNSNSTISVPSVVGFSQTNAGSTINGSSLTVGSQTSSCSQSVATGNIASQSPAAGTQVKAGTPINLVVSNGPCSASVPDVIQETQSAASAAISAVPGLTPSFTPVDCSQSGGTVGTVQSQSPSAGTVLNPPFPQTVTMSVCQQTATTTTTTTTTTSVGGGGGTTTTTTGGATRPTTGGAATP